MSAPAPSEGEAEADASNASAAGPEPATNPFAFRQYRFYWFNSLCATLATQMQVVAVGWQIYELTGSAMALGLAGLIQFAPSLLFLFAVGPIIDRWRRDRILRLCRLIEAGVALVLALGSVQGWLTRDLIFILVFLIGSAKAFSMPTAQAFMPSLVPAEVLPRAIALSSSAHQSAAIVGPALGGLLYVAGPPVVYGASTALFLIAAVLVWLIRAPLAVRLPVLISREYLFGGIAFIRRNPVLLGAIALDMFAVMLGGATALLPIFAKDILMVGPVGLGLLRCAPAVGALAMALYLSRRPIQTSAGKTLLGAVAVFGVAMLVFGLSESFALSMIALAVSGAADMISVVIRMSIMQLETPDEMRGRVSAVNSLFIGASNQIGEFESGAVAALIGAVGSVVVGGVGTLLVVALWFRLFPALAQRNRIFEGVRS